MELREAIECLQIPASSPGCPVLESIVRQHIVAFADGAGVWARAGGDR